MATWNGTAVNTVLGDPTLGGPGFTTPNLPILPDGVEISWTNGAISGTALRMPSHVTNISWTTRIDAPLTSSVDSLSVQLSFFDISRTLIQVSGLGTFNNNGIITASGSGITVPSTAVYWAYAIGNGDLGVFHTVTQTFTFSYTGTPCFTGAYSASPPVFYALTAGQGAEKDITLNLVPVNGLTHTLLDASSLPYTVYGIPTGVNFIAYQNQHGGSQFLPPGQFSAGEWLAIHYYDVSFNPISVSNEIAAMEGFDYDSATGYSTGSNSISVNPKWWIVTENYKGGSDGLATGTWTIETQVYGCNGQQALSGYFTTGMGVGADNRLRRRAGHGRVWVVA